MDVDHLPLFLAAAVALALLLGVLLVAGVSFSFLRIGWRLHRGSAFPEEGAPREAAAGVDLQRARVGRRCPFCHEPVEPAEVGCTACAAAHHEACWDEHGACAACGSDARYRRVERTAPRPRPERSGPAKD